MHPVALPEMRQQRASCHVVEPNEQIRVSLQSAEVQAGVSAIAAPPALTTSILPGNTPVGPLTTTLDAPLQTTPKPNTVPAANPQNIKHQRLRTKHLNA